MEVFVYAILIALRVLIEIFKRSSIKIFWISYEDSSENFKKIFRRFYTKIFRRFSDILKLVQDSQEKKAYGKDEPLKLWFKW